MRGVRDRDRVVTDVSAYNSSFSWGEGFFGVDADVTDDVGKAKERILAEVRRLLDKGVDKDELATAKRQVIAAVAMSGQSADGLASVLANNVIDYGDPDYHHRYAERIQSIDAAAVIEAGRRYLDPQRLMTIVLEPAAQGVPIEMPKREVEAATTAELPSEPVDLDNRAIAASIRSRARSGEARTIETAPIETFVLPNGLRVLVGRSTLVPGVAVHLYHLGGLLADPPDRLGLTNAASELRMRGTDRRSADELAGEIESLGATITTGCGNNSTFTQAVGLAEDLPRILELVADVTLHPSFPAKEWEALEQRLLAAIDARGDHWTSEIATLFRESWYAGTPWVTNSLGRREVVEKATVEELRRVHFDRLGASTAVLAVFGEVEAQRVRELATKYFGGLPATAKETFTVPAFEPPTARIVTKVSNKPLAAVQIGLGPTPTRDQPDFAKLQVLAEMLGAFPSGWLPLELRGRGPGLVYAVMAFQFSGLAPGYFGVLWNTDFGQLETALGRTVAVLDRARKETAPAEEVERAKAAVLAAEFLGKQSLSDRASDAALNVLYGMGLEEPERFAERVRSVDAAALREAAGRYLRNVSAAVLSAEPVDVALIQRVLAPLTEKTDP